MAECRSQRRRGLADAGDDCRVRGDRLVLKPAARATQQSVHINLRDISDADALTLINRLLSVLSWCDDQPMENRYGWSGTPVPVAVPRESRVIGSSIAFPFHRRLESDEKTRLALALFREGRTVNSTPFQFLSYFKVLNIFWKDKWETINGHRQNPIIEGIRATLPWTSGLPGGKPSSRARHHRAGCPAVSLRVGTLCCRSRVFRSDR